MAKIKAKLEVTYEIEAVIDVDDADLEIAEGITDPEALARIIQQADDDNGMEYLRQFPTGLEDPRTEIQVATIVEAERVEG